MTLYKNIVKLFFFLYSFSLFAQEKKAIEILYDESSSWKIEDENMDKEYKEALLKAMHRKQKYKLVSNLKQSRYTSVPKLDNSIREGNRFIEFSNGEVFRTSDFTDSIFIVKKTYPKELLVKDKLPIFNWEITREEKIYLNHPVRKAILPKKGYKITAWYAKDIPFKIGPEELWGLPGAILAVEVYNIEAEETQLIEATKISILDDDLDFSELKKSDQIITQAQYDKIFNDFVKKEREMYGGGVDTSD